MISNRRWALIVIGTAVCAASGLLAPSIGRASDALQVPPGRISLPALAGSWAISLGGTTGCGQSTMYVTTTLNAAGTGAATIHGSSTGCAAGVTTGQTFQVQTLNPDGSGTANLSCGVGCGWELTIQVPKGSTNAFTVVDVDPQNPGNVLVGTAARLWD